MAKTFDSRLEQRLYTKFKSHDFSSVVDFLNLSFGVEAGKLIVKSQKPDFLLQITKSIAQETGTIGASVDKQDDVFVLQANAIDFLNTPEVAIASMLMTAVEDVSQEYFTPGVTPKEMLKFWGDNLVGLEQSLQTLGLRNSHNRGCCADAQWNGIGHMLLEISGEKKSRPGYF